MISLETFVYLYAVTGNFSDYAFPYVIQDMQPP